MIPTAHINEGTGDNYPFRNELTPEMFEGNDLAVFGGSMVTVLGTSLQNKDLLEFFRDSTWRVIGLEMEGAHYQKAIQSASKIRKRDRKSTRLNSSHVRISYAVFCLKKKKKTKKDTYR